MARRKNEAIPDRPPDFVVDYTRMQMGAGVGTGKVLTPCAICNEPCVRRETQLTVRYVHVVELRNDGTGVAQRIARFCKAKAEQ